MLLFLRFAFVLMVLRDVVLVVVVVVVTGRVFVFIRAFVFFV